MDTITLDGMPITLEQLKERIQNAKNSKIVETSPGSGQYITLQKLQG
jgi:hypothetical protein